MLLLCACFERWMNLTCMLLGVLCFDLQAGEVPITSKLIGIHEDLETIRRDEYGNCFLRGKSETVLKNAPPKSKPTFPDARFKYWSRENKYFRIDTFSDENYETLQSKLVVTPEGYFVLRPTENGLAIVGSGTTEEGYRELLRYDFFQGSTRLNMLFGESFFANYAGITKYSIPYPKEMKNLDVSLVTNGGNLVVTSTFEATTSKDMTVREIFFSIEHPHVIDHYASKTTRGTGEVSLASGKYAYGSDTKAIPKKLFKRNMNEEGVTAECTTDIFAIELGPQPEELFKVDMPRRRYNSKGWMFTVLLAAGTVVVVAILFIRRRRGGDVQ